MEIERNGVKIQLTAEELRKAQKEQEREDLKDDFRDYLYEKADEDYDLSDDQIQEIFEKNADSAVSEFMRRYDKMQGYDYCETELKEDIWHEIVEEILEKEVNAA